MIPKGYFQTDQSITAEDAEYIKRKWMEGNRSGRPVVLGKGIKFIQFRDDVYDKAIVQCGYCGQWAAVQTECKHCGAVIL